MTATNFTSSWRNVLITESLETVYVRVTIRLRDGTLVHVGEFRITNSRYLHKLILYKCILNRRIFLSQVARSEVLKR